MVGRVPNGRDANICAARCWLQDGMNCIGIFRFWMFLVLVIPLSFCSAGALEDKMVTIFCFAAHRSVTRSKTCTTALHLCIQCVDLQVGEGILSLPAGIAAGTGIVAALLIMTAFYMVLGKNHTENSRQLRNVRDMNF